MALLPLLANGEVPQPCAEGKAAGWDGRLAGHVATCDKCSLLFEYIKIKMPK
jgi:hypothetical protein